jgi:hypothetical protein
MPENVSVFYFFFRHIWITLVGVSAGLLVGGLIGLLLGRVLANVYAASEKMCRLGVLFPWRTLTFGLIVPNLLSLLVVIRVGLGNESAMVSLGIAVTILAVAFTPGVLIRRGFARSQTVEYIATARTIATGAGMLLATILGIGSGNLGEVINHSIRIMEYRTAVNAYLLLLLSMLIFDLIFGIGQYIFSSRDMGFEV